MSGSKPQAALAVRDLAASSRFYAETLGLEVVPLDGSISRVVGPGGATLLLVGAASVAGAAGPGAGAVVPHEPNPCNTVVDPVPHQAPERPVPRPAPGAWIYLHRADLPSLSEELLHRGLAGVRLDQPYPGYRHILVPDPDGYTVVFWESLQLSDDQILSIYRDGPPRLRTTVSDLTDSQLDTPWVPGKWTLRQIIHHVVDSDLSTFNVIRMALALPDRQIQSDLWTPDDWMAGLDCARRPVGPALALLEAARDWVLEVLSHLPDGLDRSVTWPSGYRAEVRDLLRQVGGHGLHHIKQIEDTRENLRRKA